MEYAIKKLEWKQLEEIYIRWIHEHFPADEIKPLKNIRRMWNGGEYKALGMYEKTADGTGQGNLIGYAFFALAEGGSQLLLDYLAVIENYRSLGAGSIFLSGMKQYLPEYRGILIETEDISFARNEDERRTRRKRDAFYERNGAVQTGIKSRVYGVNYAIWNLPVTEPASAEECRENLENIYKIMVPGEKYEKYVSIYQTCAGMAAADDSGASGDYMEKRSTAE